MQTCVWSFEREVYGVKKNKGFDVGREDIQKWMMMETEGRSEGINEMKNYVVGRKLQAGGTACAKVW